MTGPFTFIRFPLSGGWVLWITDHAAIYWQPDVRPRLAVRFYGPQRWDR